jgi:3-methyladenine DNA glycosylase AlkD
MKKGDSPAAFTPADIRRMLDSYATEGFKRSALRFFKEPINILGVRSEDSRRVSKEVLKWYRKNGGIKEALKLARELWKCKYWEERIVGLSVLYGFQKEFDESTWRMFEGWVDDVGDWAACDFLAADILAAHLDEHPERRKELLEWTKSKNRWRRRAAAVALVKHARKGKYLADVWKVASPLMPDEDDMVRKGVGWLLREAARTAPEEVVKFCKKHEHQACRLILRTASETMSAEWKKRLLG